MEPSLQLHEPPDLTGVDPSLARAAGEARIPAIDTAAGLVIASTATFASG